MKTIIILPGGDVQFLGDVCPLDLPLIKMRRIRVSTILPANPAKRAAFRVIRSLSGDRGRAAAWTRMWAGHWICTILATGQSAVFKQRSLAVEWEMSVLTTMSDDVSIAPLD